MRIVVTGAKGFVGSVFALRAFEAGHIVTAVDDESRGLNPTEGIPGIQYIKHDCRQGLPIDRPVDVVAHFAAATGSLERPYEELFDLNVRMAQTVYQDALRLGAKAFAWPTTSLALEVPDSPYVRSKEEALRAIREVDASHNIAVPVRFFNVAGQYKNFTERRKREVHIIPRLVDCYQNHKPFIVNGTDYDTVDGTPSRDLVNVRDVADYLLYMIERRMEGHMLPVHPKDGAIWTGTGYNLTVGDMLRQFIDTIGDVQVEHGPRRAYDCARLTVDKGQAAMFRQIIGTPMLPPESFIEESKTLVGSKLEMLG